MNRNVVGRERLLALRDLQEPGEPDLVAEIVEMFHADGNARLARARGALARTDAAALRLEAHSLRGSAGVIGADALSDAALDVERCATGGDMRAAGPLVDTMARAVADVLVELAAFAGVVDAAGGAGPGPRPADGARP